MTAQYTKLLEADPELAGLLSPEERAAAAAVRLPVWTVGQEGVALTKELADGGAFGGLLLDGLLIHEISLAGRTGVRLLGPGDVVFCDPDLGALILDDVRWHSASQARIALFDQNMLTAIGRWPALTIGISIRGAQQVSRLTAQLMICQLSRVEDRVLALLWLLAESWGRVTATGTRLPLDLTHEAIGMMVGARRPTVSLALGELAAEGAVVRQRGGWLLLQTPPGRLSGVRQPEDTDGPGAIHVVVREAASAWASRPALRPVADEPPSPVSLAALHEVMTALRAQHQNNVTHFEQRLTALASLRERCQATRRRVSRERAIRSRRVPS